MKKYIPYLLGLLVLGGVVALLLTYKATNKRKLDERITLLKGDKIPYGTYVAFKSLNGIFPAASILTARQEPGYWDSLSSYEPGQLLIAVADRFNADENEMERLVTFAENGNDVFISARYISDAAANVIGCVISAPSFSFVSSQFLKDSMTISLVPEPFGQRSVYKYPGKTAGSNFLTVASSTTDVLGYDENGKPNFIHLRAGKGNFYIQLEPLAFSNYFLLHKKNIEYYEKIFSTIAPSTKTVLWDEYFRYKRDENDKPPSKKGWLNVLMRYPAFKAAMLTAFLALLLYVLLEMRRKQRPIPVIPPAKNDSLDFVKTIGRLYFDKGDHRNLARKMGTYFLEYVRNKYKISTSQLDETFVNSLQVKSGAPESEVRGIVSFIRYADDAPALSSEEVTQFYHQLESFYKNA